VGGFIFRKDLGVMDGSILGIGDDAGDGACAGRLAVCGANSEKRNGDGDGPGDLEEGGFHAVFSRCVLAADKICHWGEYAEVGTGTCKPFVTPLYVCMWRESGDGE